MKSYRHIKSGESFTAEQIVDDFLITKRYWFRTDSPFNENTLSGCMTGARNFLMVWADTGEFGIDYDFRPLCYIRSKFEEFLEGFQEIQPDARRRGAWHRGIDLGGRSHSGRRK